MKLLISLLCLLPLTVDARVIVVSYPFGSDQGLRYAHHITRTLSEVHHVPSEFILLEGSTSPCTQKRTGTSWHMCVNDNGDLKQVSVDKTFIQETLRIFL